MVQDFSHQQYQLFLFCSVFATWWSTGISEDSKVVGGIMGQGLSWCQGLLSQDQLQKLSKQTTYGDLFDKFSNGHNGLLAAMGQAAVPSRCQMKTSEPWQCSWWQEWNLDEGERGTQNLLLPCAPFVQAHKSCDFCTGQTLDPLHTSCPRSHKVSQSPCGVFFEILVTFHVQRKASTLR